MTTHPSCAPCVLHEWPPTASMFWKIVFYKGGYGLFFSQNPYQISIFIELAGPPGALRRVNSVVAVDTQQLKVIPPIDNVIVLYSVCCQVLLMVYDPVRFLTGANE